MVQKLKDIDGKMMSFRTNNQGAVLTKGKRDVYLIFKSVNQGIRARQMISVNSFNRLFARGKKLKSLGSNSSYIIF